MRKVCFVCLLIFLAMVIIGCASPKGYEFKEVHRINMCEFYPTYTLQSFAKHHHAFGDTLSRYYNGVSTIVAPLGRTNLHVVSSTSICALIDQYSFRVEYVFAPGTVFYSSGDNARRDTMPKLFIVSLGPAKTPAAIYVFYQNKHWYRHGIVKVHDGSQEDLIISPLTQLVSKARK